MQFLLLIIVALCSMVAAKTNSIILSVVSVIAVAAFLVITFGSIVYPLILFVFKVIVVILLISFIMYLLGKLLD